MSHNPLTEEDLRALEVWALARTDNGRKVQAVVSDLRAARAEVGLFRESLIAAQEKREEARAERNSWKLNAEIASAALGDSEKELTTARAELTLSRDHYVHDRIMPLERDLESAQEKLAEVHDELTTARELLRETKGMTYWPGGLTARIDAFLGSNRPSTTELTDDSLDDNGIRQVIESLSREVESAFKEKSRPKGGMQVPLIPGYFANAPPSTLSRLQWWVRALQEAVK